jgi:DNA-binding transcriptional ArsR family regulator
LLRSFLRLTDKRLAEELLGSRGRVRILEVLTEAGELNHSQICRRVGMNYHNVNTHLERLKELGMINEKRYGNIRMFEITFGEVNIRLRRNQGIDFKISQRVL